MANEIQIAEAEDVEAAGPAGRALFSGLRNAGVSFEWHDWKESDGEVGFDWAKRFQHGSVEICMNLLGGGTVWGDKARAEFTPRTGGFYTCGATPLKAARNPGGPHQFIRIVFAAEFLKNHLRESVAALHPLVRSVVTNEAVESGVATPNPLTSRQQHLLASLRRPPVMPVAHSLWYQSKALELMMEFFFKPPGEEEQFCLRQKRVMRERVKKVVEVLSGNLAEPPSLEEIGRVVGCSHFYLSRTFSAQTGMTIPQYLRQLRMEKAAELLKTGKFNVTEVALEVGYSSLSHFSSAFHATFGCCPGLYSLAPKHAVMGGAHSEGEE